MLNTIAGILSPIIPSTAFDSIATVTVGAGGSTSIDFSSIPGTYKHLQLRFMVRSAASVNSSYLRVRFNSDTSTSNYYAYHEIYADGATAAAYASATAPGGVGAVQIDQYPGNNRLASTFGVGIIDILDYTSANKNKTVRALNGYDYNGGGAVVFQSALWMNSSTAISSIELANGDGSTNFAQYSQIALYGVK